MRYEPQSEYVSGEYNTNLTDPLLIEYLGTNVLAERHHHEHEINSNVIAKLPKTLTVIGTRDNKLDMVKFNQHPFFYGVYANPEFTAKPLKPDPLY